MDKIDDRVTLMRLDSLTTILEQLSVFLSKLKRTSKSFDLQTLIKCSDDIKRGL
jgi:hypothetical protein